MKTLLFLSLALVLGGPPARAGAQTLRGTEPHAAAHPEPVPQHYTLTPERRAKAIAYSRAQYVVYFAGVALSAAIYFVFWFCRFGVALRNLARRASSRLFAQSLVFAPLFAISVAVLLLPLDFYADFVLDRRFGLSTESFVVWLGDWGKTLALTVLAAITLMWIFYKVVRRSPRRWWLYFWLATIPLELLVMFVEPYVIEPLYFKYTPLAQTQPALTARIEQMLDHAGLHIPESRIFEMNASSKTRTLNAYVSGIGASKQVVVWDTTIRALGPDETLLVLGHEMGHYVLHHIPKEFALDEMVLLVLSFIGFRAVVRLVKRTGPRTGLEDMGDLASLPAVMLVFTVLAFIATPLFNGVSRHYEHQADQYGLEVAYGVVADPNAASARSFQALGDLDLSDPEPSPFIRFWLYTHPPIEERIRFSLDYKPWARGKPMEFVRRAR